MGNETAQRSLLSFFFQLQFLTGVLEPSKLRLEVAVFSSQKPLSLRPVSMLLILCDFDSPSLLHSNQGANSNLSLLPQLLQRNPPNLYYSCVQYLSPDHKLPLHFILAIPEHGQSNTQPSVFPVHSLGFPPCLCVLFNVALCVGNALFSSVPHTFLKTHLKCYPLHAAFCTYPLGGAVLLSLL